MFSGMPRCEASRAVAISRWVIQLFVLYFTATEEAIAACITPLGLQSRIIHDSQLSASTSMSDYQLPSAGRLHNTINLNSFGAWCAADIDTDQWFQIDLLATTNLSAVASQGVQVSDSDYWVTAYSLNYSCDGVKWFIYKLQGQEAVFQGNNDSISVKTNWLPTPIVARFIRVRPLAWNDLGSICLRLELYGCQTSKVCPHPTMYTTPVVTTKSTNYRSSRSQTSSPQVRSRSSHSTGAIGMKRTPTGQGGASPTNATITDQHISCWHALGMQSGIITNSQINASSFKSFWTRPSEGRLHNRRSALRSSLGGWCADDFDTNPYLQVDFVNSTIVTGIGTQGLPGNGNWASKYQLSYSCDGRVWFKYEKGKVFKGNTDSRQVTVNTLSIPLQTRFVRLWPLQSGQYGKACVRLEIYGCRKAVAICTPRKDSSSNSTRKTGANTLSTQATVMIRTDQPKLTSEIAEGTSEFRHTTKPKGKNMIVIVRGHDQINIQNSSTACLISRNTYVLITCLLMFLYSIYC